MDFCVTVEIWMWADSPAMAESAVEDALTGLQEQGAIVSFQLEEPVGE